MDSEHKKYILENINKKSVEQISKELNLKERKIRKFLSTEKDKQSQEKVPSAVTLVNKRLTLISVALIFILGFCAYGNSMKGQFVFDDETLVLDNTYITSWSYLPNVFKEDIGAGAGKESNPYRPFQMLTYMVDYSLWKLDAKGYHLTNILLHILTAVSIYWLISILFGDQILSLLTSLLFVVHPIHTQAVSYIAGRADSLVSLFMLICFILYIKQSRTKNIGLYLCMLLSYGLAILSRENSLFLPAWLLLYHYVFKERLNTKGFLSLLSIAAGYIVLRFVVFTHLVPQTPLHNTTLLQRIPGFLVALTSYMQLMIWPVNLHMEYGDRLFPMTHFKAILGGIILFLLLLCAVRTKNRNRLIFFPIAWFLMTLLPSSNIYPINAYMAEHWLYLPSIGLFLLSAKGLCVLYQNKNFKSFAVILLAGLLGFYSFLTIRQNAGYWRDPQTFYEKTLEYASDSFRAYNNLGKLYNNIGKKKESIPLFRKAIEINPRYADAYNNLAAVSYEPGKNEEETIRLFKNAIKFDKFHAKARYNLGKIYSDTGKNDEAIAVLQEGIAINPNYRDIYNELGLIYGKMGRWEEAIALLKKAIAINPSYAEAYHSLGSLYNSMGRKEECIRSLKTAVMIDPDYAVAHTNLAIAYYYNGEYDLAVRHSDKAKELGFQVDLTFLKLLEPYR